MHLPIFSSLISHLLFLFLSEKLFVLCLILYWNAIFLLKVLYIFPFSSKNTIRKFCDFLIASTDTISASADSLIVLMDIIRMSINSWVRFSEFLFCFWISNAYRSRKVRYNLTLLFSPNEYKAPLLLKPNRPVRFALYPRSSVKEKRAQSSMWKFVPLTNCLLQCLCWLMETKARAFDALQK